MTKFDAYDGYDGYAEDADGPAWDETVDVLCIGVGPGSLAYGILCAAAGLDVLIVESGHLDPETLDYLSRMTEDLGDPAPDARLEAIRAEPQPPVGPRERLETFVGEELRLWSARCLASPFGVLLTEVPDLLPMRTPEGLSVLVGRISGFQCDPERDGEQPGPALKRWLEDRAEGLFGPAEDRLAGLVHHGGRIAGVSLHTEDGTKLIGADRGLALSIGADPQTWPAQPDLGGLPTEVAVVGRRGGRFAKVELLES